MSAKKIIQHVLLTATFATALPASAASVYITEWMYNGVAEFVEFTNLSTTSVDFTGWSFDDDSRLPGALDLSAFGMVAPGESVVITESGVAQFRADWSLSSSIKVIGEFTNNLGRNDEINLFDNLGNLVDRLTYGDQTFSGSIRTQSVSGRPGSGAALGANDPYLWVFSTFGDADGAYY